MNSNSKKPAPNFNSWVLITGTTSGIGEAFTQLFAQKGFHLILVARNPTKLLQQVQVLQTTYPAIKIQPIIQDLSLPDAALHVFQKTQDLGLQPDILINNAGFATFGQFTELAWFDQKALADVNMQTVMQFSYLFGREMVKRRQGKILNVASIAAWQAGPYMAMYYASKAFVLSFSQALHNEFSPHQVTVTALCPGPTRTNFEHAARMKNSLMFTKLHVDSPATVAQVGYRSLMKGKAVCVVNWRNKFATFIIRFLPFSLTRRLASFINIGK